MKLNDILVRSFEYEGKTYNIDLSFDNVLDVFDVLDDEELTDYNKANIALELLTGEVVEGDATNLWEHVYKTFIAIETKQAIEYDIKGNPMPVREDTSEEKLVDIKQDAEYIYTSFIQAYNINLFKEQGKLQWQEFRALLNGLPSNTIMQKIIQIRLWKPSKGESSEYKDSMRKLKRTYKLE